MEIRLLAEYRGGLAADRTRAQNRLRWHLLELCPQLEVSSPAGALDRSCRPDRIARALTKLPPTARVRVAREEVRRICELTRSATALERELAVLVKVHRPALLAERGWGALTAATLIARTAGAERFPTDGHFARQAGGADPRVLRAPRSHPPEPGRGSPTQLCAAPDRRHPHADRSATRASCGASWPKARPGPRCSGASSATSPGETGNSCRHHRSPASDRATVRIEAPISVPCLTWMACADPSWHGDRDIRSSSAASVRVGLVDRGA
jgi:hypothetical protein